MPMSQPCSHIVFDLDGTLIDSAPSILASMQAAFDAAGLRPSRPLVQDLIGPPLHTTLASLLPAGQGDSVDKLAALFKSHYDATGYRDTRAYEGIASMLEALRRRGCRLLIATNKRILPTRRIIDHLRWNGLFEEVHALDAFMPPLRSKAEMLTALRSRLHAPAVYVGDRPEDATAAQQAGLPFFLVAWGYAPADYLETQRSKAQTPQALAHQLQTIALASDLYPHTTTRK